MNNQRFRVQPFPTNPSKYAWVRHSGIMWGTWVSTKSRMSQCSRPWNAVSGCTVDVEPTPLDSLHIPLLTSSGHVRNKQINRTKPGTGLYLCTHNCNFCGSVLAGNLRCLSSLFVCCFCLILSDVSAAVKAKIFLFFHFFPATKNFQLTFFFRGGGGTRS